MVAPLPARRVDLTFAFVHVGLDFLGPLSVLVEPVHVRDRKKKSLTTMVKLKGKNVMKKVKPNQVDEERWVKLFVLVLTCMTTRMVHFEYLFHQTTDDFIFALQRFIARRGHPSTISCDNALCFRKAERECYKLYRSFDWDALQKEFLRPPYRIQWIFNPPLAPHHGGVFEAVVGACKRALRATLGRDRATLEEFRTILCRAESVCNGRPLTSVSEDPDDPLPLTPAHLALGRGLAQIPDEWGKDDTQDSVAVRWKQRSRLHAEFAGRFRKEYLQSLQPFAKWLDEGKEPRPGEIVLVQAAPRTRLFWPLARILETHKGRDSKVRTCTLWLNGEKTRRDIRYLYRLEEAVTQQQHELEMQQQRDLWNTPPQQQLEQQLPQQPVRPQQQPQQQPLRREQQNSTRRQQRQLWPRQQ